MHSTALGALVLLVACGPTVAMIPADPAPRALRATSPANVAVYMYSEPTRPYTEIAVLLAQHGDRTELVDALRHRAADLGCDAVIVDAEIAQSGPRTVPAADAPAWWARRHPAEGTLVPATQHELDGSCILYQR